MRSEEMVRRGLCGAQLLRGGQFRQQSSGGRRICRSTNLGGGYWWEHSFKGCDVGSTALGGLWGGL